MNAFARLIAWCLSWLGTDCRLKVIQHLQHPVRVHRQDQDGNWTHLAGGVWTFGSKDELGSFAVFPERKTDHGVGVDLWRVHVCPSGESGYRVLMLKPGATWPDAPAACHAR